MSPNGATHRWLWSGPEVSVLPRDQRYQALDHVEQLAARPLLRERGETRIEAGRIDEDGRAAGVGERIERLGSLGDRVGHPISTWGYIVAFSFTKGAHEEAARAKAAKGITVELVEVAELLKDTSDLVTPQATLLGELPIPAARPPEALPSVEELVASEHETNGLARVAEEPVPYRVE